jgi:ParB/RepB/Spo0J family partition protein
MSAEVQFQSLPHARCVVWAQNPRRTVGDLTELAESVRSVGVLEPLLARPRGDGWEILAGQRRFLAAGLAGLTEVPALVRDVPDDVALELALAENSARADVSPLEEAEAIERLVRDHGRSVADVAARLGRGVRWVERRRSLLNLTTESRAWCGQLAVPLAHMESLSTLGTEAQARVIARLSYITESKHLPSHANFSRMVVEELRDLASAPFALDDAGLGGHGACVGCSMRSDRQQSLFDEAPPGARCLDDACWRGKVDTHWELAQRDARKRKLKVLDIRDVGRDWTPGTLNVAPDAPWTVKAPSKDAKPAAVVRGAQGHVYELYARPDTTTAVKLAPDPDEANERNEADDAESDRESANLYEQRRAAREAAEVERLTRVFALTADPTVTEAFLRSALVSEVYENGLVTARRLAKLVGVELQQDVGEEAFAEAVPAGVLWRVLLTCLCETRLADLAVDGPDLAAPWERPLLARLAAAVPQATRVWIAEAAWDALPTDEREGLEEPIGGAPLPWEGREGWVTALVPGELLSTVRGLAEAAGVTLYEGDAVPVVAAAPTSVTLSVKRSVWQQHRSGLQDSAKGALHKAWHPVGEDRVATVERGSDAHTKVTAYAAQHGLDVRVGGGE